MCRMFATGVVLSCVYVCVRAMRVFTASAHDGRTKRVVWEGGKRRALPHGITQGLPPSSPLVQILHVQAAPAWWLFVVDMGGNKEG